MSDTDSSGSLFITQNYFWDECLNHDSVNSDITDAASDYLLHLGDKTLIGQGNPSFARTSSWSQKVKLFLY